jgi:hypothetical protein
MNWTHNDTPNLYQENQERKNGDTGRRVLVLPRIHQKGKDEDVEHAQFPARRGPVKEHQNARRKGANKKGPGVMSVIKTKGIQGRIGRTKFVQ